MSEKRRHLEESDRKIFDAETKVRPVDQTFEQMLHIPQTFEVIVENNEVREKSNRFHRWKLNVQKPEDQSLIEIQICARLEHLDQANEMMETDEARLKLLLLMMM